MFTRKTKCFLQVISVLLTFAIFAGSFTAVAESEAIENSQPTYLISDNLTKTTASANLFNKYANDNYEQNIADIVSYNESGEVDYLYTLNGTVAEISASLDLNFRYRDNELENRLYQNDIDENGAESFTSAEGNYNFMNSVYGLGTGWSLALPQIEYIDSEFAYFHFADGKTYRIVKNEDNTYSLNGFPYDYTISENIQYAQEDTNGTLVGYIGTDRYGNKDYFDLNGRFIKSADNKGDVLQSITYDVDNVISSITENEYTINFVRTPTADGVSVAVKMTATDKDGNQITQLLYTLVIVNGKLVSITETSENEETYPYIEETNTETEEETEQQEVSQTETQPQPAPTVNCTDTINTESTIEFIYSEKSAALLLNSEISTIESGIDGTKYLLLTKVTETTETITERVYSAIDTVNQAAVELAETYNQKPQPPKEIEISNTEISYSKGYKLYGEQSSLRYDRLLSVESTLTSKEDAVVTETDDSVITEASKTTNYLTYENEKVIQDVSSSNEYDLELGEFSDNQPIEKTLYSYAIPEEAQLETNEAVAETITTAVTISNSTYEEDEETLEYAWTTPEATSTIGRNANGEVVYNHSDDNAIYYAYNVNGSPIKEVIQDGLTYTYTYGQYEVLHTTAFDIYTITYDTNGNITDISKSNGDETSISLNSYGYDNGNVISESYANGQILLYDYTDNGNVSAVYLGAKTDDNKRFSYAYNTTTVDDETTEELSSISDHTNDRVTKFSYVKDEEGNITSTTTNVYSVSEEYEETLLYSYIESETQRTVTIGENETAVTYSMVDNYETDQDGNYVLDEDNEKVVISTDYKAIIESNGVMWYNTNNKNADGQLTTSNVAVGENNILSTGYIYDEENESISEVNSTIGATTITLSYSYDEDGNITEISDGTNTVTYEYDNLQELIRSNDQFNNKTYTYEYDSRGNILSKKEYAYTTSEDLTGITPTKTDTFGYTNTVWADELTSFNGNAITYDQSGNPLTYNGYTYTWDMGRQLKQISNGTNTYSYTYDDSGIRSSKTINGVTTNYITKNGTILAEYRDGHKITYSYDENDSIIGFSYNDTYYAYNKNIQGDIIGIIDATGAQIATYTYDAWGNITSLIDISTNNIGSINPMRYRGYYLDTETNYYYLQSRYYNPELCRFINADDTRFIGATGTVLSTNAFIYCENNSILNSDITGKWIHYLVGAIIGGVISVTFYIIDCVLSRNKVSVLKSLLTFLNGALNGVIAASGAGVLIQIIASIATNIADIFITSRKPTTSDFAMAIIGGILSGIFAGVVPKSSGKHLNYLMKKFGKKIARNIFKSSFGKTLLNSIKYVFKNSKKILWKFIKKYCLPNIGINISNRVYKLIYSY